MFEDNATSDVSSGVNVRSLL